MGGFCPGTAGEVGQRNQSGDTGGGGQRNLQHQAFKRACEGTVPGPGKEHTDIVETQLSKEESRSKAGMNLCQQDDTNSLIQRGQLGDLLFSRALYSHAGDARGAELSHMGSFSTLHLSSTRQALGRPWGAQGERLCAFPYATAPRSTAGLSTLTAYRN